MKLKWGIRPHLFVILTEFGAQAINLIESRISAARQTKSKDLRFRLIPSGEPEPQILRLAALAQDDKFLVDQPASKEHQLLNFG
jgi:hypothetical protein